MQQFDVTILYKFGSKHSDAGCLSRTPIDQRPQVSDEDSTFFRVVMDRDLAAQQRADPELRVMIDYLEGRNGNVLKAFNRNLPAFSLKNTVLEDKKFSSETRTNYLLVIPADLRAEIGEACHDDPSSGHSGTAHTIGKIKSK